MQDFEKLGVFYLGRKFDLATRTPIENELVLYDSKDMVTHAVCVGMTGSGKTGLCLAILEEAAIDGIPAIVIDPKGDLTNLKLTFPQLTPQDFRPWINEDDARKKNVSPEEFAAQQAQLWKDGLAKWGQSPDRIKRFQDAAEVAIYTPGSSAGIGVSVLRSFAAPDQAIVEDPELLRERVATTATSILGLLGIDADPIQSREHILISTILMHAWQQGRDLDITGLIQQIQNPPVNRVGVMEVESFYPSKERFALAMRLNNLLASPGFEGWMQGEALDINSILYRADGKPRIAIFSIAHLGDAERMFFVSLLLNQVLSWMRSQSGTTSLRALLYMDEIFGYFPPTANPPSKAPLLTLLKQARAFGLGVMLATQNPVDLDYKGLSNCGTWFIGRLQTERDKNRLLDGLEGAAAGQGKFDRSSMEQILAGLGQRVFLMNNVHDDAPEVFESRWVMSYLRGPLGRDQIKRLMSGKQAAASAAPTAPAAASSTATSSGIVPAVGAVAHRPVLAPEVPQGFIPLRSDAPEGASLVYRAMLLGCAKVYFRDTKTGVETEQDLCGLALLSTAINWEDAADVELTESDLDAEPSRASASYGELPAGIKAKTVDAWRKSLADHLYRSAAVELYRSALLKEVSKPGESERDFRLRLGQRAREARDEQVEKLRQKFAPKFGMIQERLRRAGQMVAREKEQAGQSKVQTAISIGGALLGAFLGRKVVSSSNIGRASTAARGAGRAYKESQDIDRAEETVDAIKQQLAALEAQFQAETDALDAEHDPAALELETVSIKPKKTDITVRSVTLAWTPYWRGADGTEKSAWE
jgi:hypothetical protein